VCNECEAVVRAIPADRLQQTLDEMELDLEVASAKCSHCGAVDLAPGVSALIALVCDECGEAVAPIGV